LEKSLIKNTGIYFIVNLLSQFAVFVLWIIIAGVLSPLEVGVYALAIFIVDFFGAFAIFGLNSAITRFYYSEESVQEVFFNSLIILIASIIISVAALFLSAGFISWFIPGISGILNGNIFLFNSLILTSSIYNFALSHYSALKRTLLYAKVSLSQTILFFLFALLFLYIKLGILGIFYALFISYSIPALLFIFQEIKSLSFRFFSIKIIKSLLHYSIPMMLYSILGTIVMYAGRIFLDKYASISTLGVYGFFLIVMLQINAIWSTFNKAWTPEIFSQLKENKKRALENVKSMAFISSFVYSIFFIMLIIFKQVGLLGLFIKPIYLSNIYILYILLLAPLFTGIYTSAYPLFYYKKKTGMILMISIALNFLSIALTFFMVKSFSQMGAALSYFISSALSVFVFLFAFKKDMGISSSIIKWALFVFSAAVLGIYIFLETSSSILLLFIFVAIALLAYKFGSLSKKQYLLVSLWKDIGFKFKV